MTNVEVGHFKKTHLQKLYNALDDAIKEYAAEHHTTYAEIFGVLDILKWEMYRDLITGEIESE